MKFVLISDTHTQHNELEMPDGDILIHSGDFSYRGTPKEVNSFLNWLIFQKKRYEHVLFVAGNHDLSFEKEGNVKERYLSKCSRNNIHYLENSGVSIKGVNFWGSPYQPEFMNWAFNYKRNSKVARLIWNLVPQETNVLISHGPAKGVLDKCARTHIHYPQYAGCEVLREMIDQSLKNLKLFTFGHIHESVGIDTNSIPGVTCVNASSVDLSYKVKHQPLVFELDI